MSGLAWWLDGSPLWDTLILGGDVVPGLAVVTGDVERGLDIQPVKGSDGATITDTGYIAAPLAIAVRLWSRDQWEDWQRLLPKIHPRNPGGPRSPLEIIHPAANLIGVNQIYIRKISAPSITNQVAHLALTCVQWFPAPKPAKKNSSKPKATPSSAFDPADLEIPSPADDGSADAPF